MAIRSLFNIVLVDYHPLFLWSLASFFIIFTFRKLFIKGFLPLGMYHIFIALSLFIAAIGGGGVQNDAYERYEQFIQLEEKGLLTDAKNHPDKHDPMLRIDLQQFNNSHEFKNYLQYHDRRVDRAEAITIGWIFALLAEVSLIIVKIVS